MGATMNGRTAAAHKGMSALRLLWAQDVSANGPSTVTEADLKDVPQLRRKVPELADATSNELAALWRGLHVTLRETDPMPVNQMTIKLFRGLVYTLAETEQFNKVAQDAGWLPVLPAPDSY